MEAHDTGSVASTPTSTRFPQTPTSTRYPPTPTHGSPFAFTHPEEPPPAVPTHAIPRRAVNTSKKPPAKAGFGAKSRPPRDLPTFSAAPQFNAKRRSSTSSMQGANGRRRSSTSSISGVTGALGSPLSRQRRGSKDSVVSNSMNTVSSLAAFQLPVQRKVGRNRGASAKGVSIMAPGESAASPATLNMSVTSEPLSPAFVPIPGKRNRVRGMSSVKKFEQEYMNSDFLKEFQQQQSAQASPSPQRGQKKGPMPNVVDLWAQVSKLKEDALKAKKAEADAILERDDWKHKHRAMQWNYENACVMMLNELAHHESHAREIIESSLADLRFSLALIMNSTEPIVSNIGYQEPIHNESDLHRELMIEISKRHHLEDTLENTEDRLTLLKSLEGAQDELRDLRMQVAQYHHEKILSDDKAGRFSAQSAIHSAQVSRLETQILQEEATNRKLTTQVDELRKTVADFDADKKRLIEAHRKLAEAELRAAQAASASIAAGTLAQETASFPASSPMSHAMQRSLPTSPCSPRRGYLGSPRYNVSGSNRALARREATRSPRTPRSSPGAA